MLKKVLSCSKTEVLLLRNPFINTAVDLFAEARAAGESEAEQSSNSIWWTVPDLNRRPLQCECSALPAELTAPMLCRAV